MQLEQRPDVGLSGPFVHEHLLVFQCDRADVLAVVGKDPLWPVSPVWEPNICAHIQRGAVDSGC